MSKYLLSAIGLYLMLSAPLRAQDATAIFHPKHQFSDYPAVESFPASGRVSVNLQSHKDGAKFRSAFKNIEISTAEKFAGHFVIVSWGCGTSCQECDIVDITTGKIYTGLATGTGYKAEPNSNLFLADPPDDDGTYTPDCATCAHPALYLWHNNKFELLQKTVVDEGDYKIAAKSLITAIKKRDLKVLSRYIPEQVPECSTSESSTQQYAREDLLTDIKLSKGDKVIYEPTSHSIDVVQDGGHSDVYLTLSPLGDLVHVSCVRHSQMESE